MSCDIFISYRRDDATSEAGRLADAFRHRFGDHTVFVDTGDMRIGDPWPDALSTALAGSTAVVVVIGPEWILARDEYGRRRIDDPADWVRREVELALGHEKRVLPLLVRHARMPPRHVLPPEVAPLAERQALTIRAETWPHDVSLVLDELGTALQDRRAERLAEPPPGPPAGSASGGADDFRAIALGFDSADVGARNATAAAVKDLAASLEIADVLRFCRSRKTAERVGGAIALGVHLRSSPAVRQDRGVLATLAELLADASSFVRYRAAEVVRSSPTLVPTFEDELSRLGRVDENSYVREMAQRALRAARH